MTDEGIYGPRLRDLGITVRELNFPAGRVTLKGLYRLWRLIREGKPDAVQTWMYHADLAGGLIARLAGIRLVIWGIRNSHSSPESLSRSARWAARLCAWLSAWLPVAIVSCSEHAAHVHQRMGYDASKFTVIPNGYDLEQFSPRRNSALSLRKKLGVGSHVPLVGMVARWDPQKDHANLLAALAIIANRGRDFRCVLAGEGVGKNNEALGRLIFQNRLQDKVTLLGPLHDISNVMNALDLFILSSRAEAFPNVVAEAMACGTPCVVTAVGDAALIVADTGWVAPPENPGALAASIENGLSAIESPQREKISQACRARIVNSFGLDQMTAAYLDIWCGYIRRKNEPKPGSWHRY